MNGMGRRITVPIAISADPGSDKYYELWEVDFPKVRTDEIELHFEDGVMNVLFASLYYGDMKVAPETGEWTSDGGVIRDYPDIVYYRGDKIRLRVRNEDTANPHKIWGTLELEEEEE